MDPRERSLVRDLGLVLPDGLVERGYRERQEHPDDGAPGGVRVFESEVWMLREPIGGN